MSESLKLDLHVLISLSLWCTVWG